MTGSPQTHSRADQRREFGITWTSIVVNLALGAAKTGIGIIAHSTAIIADGLHSLSDLASDMAVLWSIRSARIPPDADHHYGHRRYESVITFVVGSLLLATAVYVAGHSILTIGVEHAGPDSWWPFWAAVASIVLKELLFWTTRAVGRRTRNTAILANAWHHRTDSFSSIAAAIGIGAGLVLGPRWTFLDHLTAVVLASFLVVVGIRILRDSMRELSDRAPAPEEQRQMQSLITSIPGVVGFHAFRARRTGGLLEMDVHVQVRPDLTVEQGHDIASRVEQTLRDGFPGIAGAIVHIEPAARDGGVGSSRPR